MQIPLGAIVGPTATGKSDIGLEVADLLDGEILSIDSMQVYKGMNIGTAKLTENKRYSSSGKYIKHHLIDLVTPDKDFSAADFQCHAKRAIEEVYSRNKLPLLVGGTGLYYHAIIYDYSFKKEPEDKSIRKNLEKIAVERGNKYLYEELLKIDPKIAEKIHPNNTKRLIRAHEMYYLTGKKMSEINDRPSDRYNAAACGLYLEREKLYERINSRVDKMIKEGLIEEVEYLLENEMLSSKTAVQALGYKEIIDYIKGETDYETCTQQIKRNTRRFAKRQLTWFKRDKNIIWFNLDDYQNSEQLSKSIACNIRRRLKQ